MISICENHSPSDLDSSSPDPNFPDNSDLPLAISQMTAETEVCNVVSEAAGIEQKPELHITSCQDLSKTDSNGISHRDQANDPDNSYVFVTGSDGLTDDPLDNKDMVAGDATLPLESNAPIVLSGVDLDAQNEKSDILDGEVNKSIKGGKHGSVEGSDGNLTVVNGIHAEQEISNVDGDGVQHTLEVNTLKNKCFAESDAQNGKLDITDGEVKKTFKEGENENRESTDGNLPMVNGIPAKQEISIVDGNGVQHTLEVNTQKNECFAESNAQNGKLDITDGEVKMTFKEGEIENRESTDGNLPVVNGIPSEQEISIVDGDGVQHTLEVNTQQNKCFAESDAQNGKLDITDGEVKMTFKEGENENGESTDGNPSLVNSILVGQESFIEDGDGIEDKQDEHIRKTDCGEEAEIKLVDAPNRKVESSEEVEIENVEDQNEKIEGVAEAEHEKVEDQLISESSPSLEENQESEVPNLEVVAELGEEEELNNLLAPLNESGKTKYVHQDETNLGSTETSQHVGAEAFECELQDVSKEESGVNLTSEVMETAEHDVLLATSLDSNLGFCPINKQETIEEAKPALGTEVTENRKWDTVHGHNVQCEQDKEKIVGSNVDCHDGIVCDQVLEEKNNDGFSLSHVEDGVQYPEGPGKHPYCNGLSPEILNSETETEASVLTQSFSASSAEVREPLTEVKTSGAETVGDVYSPPIDDPKSEIVGNRPFGQDSRESFAANGGSSDSDSALGTMVCNEKEPISQGGDAHDGTEVSSGNSIDGHCPPARVDVNLEPEVHKSSAVDNAGMTGDADVTSRTEALESFVVDKEGASNTIIESADVKDNGDQLGGAIGSSAETLSFQKIEDTGSCEDTGSSHSDNISKALLEGSCADAIRGKDVSVDAVSKPFNFLIRIPRFNDEKLREQIRNAKLEVDEKTKLRDAIQAQIQEKRANNQIHGVDYEYAKGEDRSVRKLMRLKRMEIDSLQSVINKAKNAISIEEMDIRINNMEHMIQHETLPLKEEKQLIREIKQLKQLREQLSSNMGDENEIQEALEQREMAEENLKISKKELGILKNSLSKAQTATVEAESKYDDENKKVKELQAQFRAADDVRQAAYAKLQSLRKELTQKNKYFFKYKDDEAKANKHAFSQDKEALYQLCTDQVERFMELWNWNDEFRNEYVRFNTRSTVRRLGTLDGRSLGPDEKPPILPSYVNERNDRVISMPASVDSISQSPTPELKQVPTVNNVTSDSKSMKKVTQHEDQAVTNKGSAKHKLGNSLVTVSGRDISDEVQEESMKTREEVELIRKAEETRREEAEGKLKEHRRLEELAKAKEAREKKKRHDEKVQMREELRARKEAELKEKEREKKLRKKERKKAVIASTDVNDGSNTSGETGESGMEIQVNDISSSVTIKKPKKTSITIKQNKTKSVPPPLRNRNKKKWQQWMWVCLTSLVVIVLFWLGNMGVFANVNLKRRSPAF